MRNFNDVPIFFDGLRVYDHHIGTIEVASTTLGMASAEGYDLEFYINNEKGMPVIRGYLSEDAAEELVSILSRELNELRNNRDRRHKVAFLREVTKCLEGDKFTPCRMPTIT